MNEWIDYDEKVLFGKENDTIKSADDPLEMSPIPKAKLVSPKSSF